MAYENLDQKILNALLDDGRASLRSLGGDLNVSVTTVSNHISNLEEDDVIRGYPPIDDYGELSYDVMAILQLNVKWSALPDITYRLQEHRDMVTVHETTGDHDIIVVGGFSDTDHMNDQIKELLVDPDINESIRVLSSTPSPRTNSSTSSTETPLSASLFDVYSLLTRMYS